MNRKQAHAAYVKGGTIPTSIPSGRVLVHNHVVHSVSTRCGTRGFRAWVQKPSAELEPCGCGWAGLPHFKVKGAGDGLIPPHRHVRAVAYGKALRLQKAGPAELHAAIESRQRRGLDLDTAAEAVILDTFADYCAIGGNPHSLLAACHNGMTLDQFLAVPWPPPAYVKKHKRWQDEPLELREARAKYWPGRARWAALVKTGRPGLATIRRIKADAYRKAEAFNRETGKGYPNKVATECERPGVTIYQLIDERFARLIAIGGDPHELMHAVSGGLTLREYTADPSPDVPYRKGGWRRKRPTN